MVFSSIICTTTGFVGRSMKGVLSRGRAVRAQCVQSVLSRANADAVIGALSAAEALLPAPCGTVIHVGVEAADLLGAAVMHITHGTLAQAPDAIAPVPSAHVMLSQAHPPGAVAKTLVAAISTVQCLLPPFCSPILTVVIETAALIGACVLQLYKPTAHTPVATSAAPPGFMDIAFAPAPCPEILPAGHAARANMAQPRGPGVIITVLVMLVSAAEALLPACCAPTFQLGVQAVALVSAAVHQLPSCGACLIAALSMVQTCMPASCLPAIELAVQAAALLSATAHAAVASLPGALAAARRTLLHI